MAANRVFFPQQTLDEWLDEGRIGLRGEELSITATGYRFRLEGALHFVADVSETSDPHQLVGKVKTAEEVQAMAGEHCADSVLLGESAYQVVEGFLGDALAPAGDETGAAKAKTGARLEPNHPLGQLVARLQTS